MSVLAVPRIFFNGYSQWDPNTTNNNDQWATYDFVHADLNWPFLATQNPPITRDNYQQLFPTWVLVPQYYPGQPGWWQPPSEWNFFGGYETLLYDAISNRPTLITGGQLAYGQSPLTADPLVGARVNLWGDAYPGSESPTAARLIDVNPDAFWNTLFRLRTFEIGDVASPGRYLHGEVQPGSVMSTRWMYLQRDLNTDSMLELAGVAGIVMQACLPNNTLRIDAGNSELLRRLDAARQSAAGVMVRLCVYTTQYFLGSAFADCRNPDGTPNQTKQYARLVCLWNDALTAGRAPMQNPAVSNAVGTFGLWMGDELVAQPGGRYLIPDGTMIPRNAPTNQPSPGQWPLGMAAAELHAGAGPGGSSILSLDLGNTIPELNRSGVKADFGPLTVAVQSPGGQRTIGTIPSQHYSQQPYEATAGIIDLPLPAGITPQDVIDGNLMVTAGGTTLLSETALSSAALTVGTDDLGVYVDQGQTGSLTLQVRQKGAVPTIPVNVLLQIYLPVPRPPGANAGSWSIPDPGESPLIEFTNAPNNTITIQPGGRGEARVTFRPLAPGFPIIVFFPYPAGGTPPTPPAQILPVYQPGTPLTITTAAYSSVRVMPFDNALPGEFADLWNTTHDRNRAWQFVYDHILYLYDMIYPAMKYYAGLDLGNQGVVDDTIGLILQLTSTDFLDKTTYMPITRDLSAGKRVVLQMYGLLVEHNFQLETLAVPE